MTLKVKDAGGTLRTITSMKVRDGTITRDVKTMKVLDGGTLRTVATFGPSMTASAPSGVATVSYTNASMTSATVTCTPSGGVSPYTYAWTITSGSATINSPSTASTTFSKTVGGFDAPEYATARCTVTDSAGNTATADVGLSFVLISPIP